MDGSNSEIFKPNSFEVIAREEVFVSGIYESCQLLMWTERKIAGVPIQISNFVVHWFNAARVKKEK